MAQTFLVFITAFRISIIKKNAETVAKGTPSFISSEDISRHLIQIKKLEPIILVNRLFEILMTSQ